jgi:murein DD-endopeptidase MepM/ murein hydrolase activator NlpD
MLSVSTWPTFNRSRDAEGKYSGEPHAARATLDAVKRFLAFLAAAALGVTMMLPATAFADPEPQPVLASGATLTPQSLVAGQDDAAAVLRDPYTIEAPKPPPVASTGHSATPIPGLLTTWPCYAHVNDGYAPRGEGFHYGIDIMCSSGTTIVAAGSGIVLESTDDGGSYGSYVKIDHGNGVATLCAHMITGSQTVSVGQSVNAGDMIGLVGDTGYATAPHCHFEVWVNGVRVEPLPWLP